MKDKRSAHLKVQELCDCFATADPLSEMGALRTEAQDEDAPLKWIALAVLHGVNAGAEKISLSRDKEGNVEVRAKYRTSPLPTPGPELGSQIVQAARGLIHGEEEKGKSPLALGIRDSSIELQVKYKKDEDKEKCSIVFPE